MPSPSAPIWTTSRRLMGNLAPLVVIAPCLGWAMYEVVYNGLTSRGWLILGLAAGAGWLSVNLLGLIGNGSLKRRMAARIHEDRPFDRTQRWFVGFARPKFKGLLDPHEDIGFLFLENERLLFLGETRKVELHRDQVVRVHFRPNIHTFLLLGGWIAVEAVLDGVPGRLLVEPRDSSILVVNFIKAQRIRKDILSWASRTDPLQPVA